MFAIVLCMDMRVASHRPDISGIGRIFGAATVWQPPRIAFAIWIACNAHAERNNFHMM